MWLLDWVTGKIDCPRCGTSGAKEINGSIHCPNPACAYFSNRVKGKGVVPSPAEIAFTPPTSVPPGSLAIHYIDFRGQPRTFIAEAASARRVKNHINVQVAPKGARIVLSRDRIQNLAEVDSALPQRIELRQEWPTPRERQVMTYHKKRGSTSPLFESIRAKYPNW